MTDRIVLAYSGSPATLAAIPWLKRRYGAAVIAATVDVGQQPELETTRDRALAAGALRAHVLDLRETFAHEFVLPALRADALSGGGFPLAAALARPLVARTLVEIADIEQAGAVAHGAARVAGEAPVEVALRSLRPGLEIVAAYEGSNGHGLAGAAGPRVNLWGRSVRRAAGQPADAVYTLTRAPADCPDEAAAVEIAFERGVPASINGVEMPILDLVSSLGTIAGAHGVGRLEWAANGDAVRTFCEAPAGVVLHAAHRALQRRVSSGAAERVACVVASEYAALVTGGLWFTPLRGALDAFVNAIQEDVTGVVRVTLFKGGLDIA